MLLKGKIIKGIGGFYYVDTENGVIECRARGKFRKDYVLPMVGDSVTIEVSENGKGYVKDIDERKNHLVRPAVSNIDFLVIVAAISNPMPDTALIDKMLVICEREGIKGALCINKSDLDEEENAERMAEAYKKAGYDVFVTSAEKNVGLDELRKSLKGRTTAFAGLSGVGKSSILSIITGNELKTGETSKIERGRHTTRHIELIKIDDGYVFDTPGFSQLEIEGLLASDLRQFFPEVWEREGQCRFRGCSHTAEPDCAVKKALSEGAIAQSRYDSYTKLYEKLKDIKEWQV